MIMGHNCKNVVDLVSEEDWQCAWDDIVVSVRTPGWDRYCVRAFDQDLSREAEVAYL